MCLVDKNTASAVVGSCVPARTMFPPGKTIIRPWETPIFPGFRVDVNSRQLKYGFHDVVARSYRCCRARDVASVRGRCPPPYMVRRRRSLGSQSVVQHATMLLISTCDIDGPLPYALRKSLENDKFGALSETGNIRGTNASSSGVIVSVMAATLYN